jgi:2-keto-3-deoxy-L-rhamnonate aldolase RhmA
LKNNLKRKLQSGELCLGTWITIGNPDVVDILKNLEFDWFLFDAEHSYLSIETVKSMMQALGDGARQTPLVRIGISDQLLVKRALDIGSQGIMVPLVQIETTQALSNLDEILQTKGVDIGFAGPSDLTMSLGLIDDRWNPKVVEAMTKVVKACEKYGKTPGTLAASVEEAKKWIGLGFKFVSLGSDAKQLVMGARSFLKL